MPGYTIGTFAMINKISARMLRHYDKIGLFKPQMVLPNGYRYYSSEQVPTISLIKKYQRCGFTLAEISTLLGASATTIKSLARKKQRQLVQQNIEQDQANELLSNLLGIGHTPLPSDNVIAVTQQPARQLLCGSNVCEDNVDAGFDDLYRALENAQVHPDSLPLLLCDPEAAVESYRVAVCAQQGTVLTTLISHSLPVGTYISTSHYGSYDGIGVAYDRLLQYAQHHQQKLVMPFIERYFLDRTYTTNTNDYITEISVKMTP